MPEAAVAVAFSIGVDSLSAAVVGLGGQRPARGAAWSARAATTPSTRSSTTSSALLDRCRAAVPNRDALVGVGVAVAGVVRSRDGLVETAPNLGWTGAPLGGRLAARLGLDVPVVVANEADLGVLAEHRRGAAVGVDDVLYIHGEVGVGGGLIVGGRPLRAPRATRARSATCPMVPDGAPCRCGSRGCWETEVGGDALLARAGLPTRGRRGRGRRRVPRRGRRRSARPWRRSRRRRRRSGTGLAGLVNIFNPRV